MKTPFCLFVFFGFFFQGYSQNFKIISSEYNTFDSRKIQVYLIEGKYVVLNIDKIEINQAQLKDTSTLIRLLNRADSLYAFYKRNLGTEPPGGNVNYGNKTNIFFGAPSCGSGCGAVGSKGIEVSGFNNMFFNLKYKLNVNRDVILGYEFGRNFFTFGNKVLFPFTPGTAEKNGGFAEGFAAVFYTYAFDEAMKDPEERIFNETLLNPIWARKKFIGYINDTIATPYNTLAKWDLIGVRDDNRGFDEFQTNWDAFGIFHGIISTIGRDKLFPNFFNELKTTPNVVTIEDALSNLAVSASKGSNYNLNAFFKNVLKFKLNPSVEAEIAKLPPIPSKLIQYEDLLWFISPFSKVRLNMRSTNYLADNLNYEVLVDNVRYSYSKNGNNELGYEVLKNKNEATVVCRLLDGNNKIVDTFKTIVKKRHNINLMNYKQDWYAYYLSNSVTKSYILDSNFVLESKNDTTYDVGLLWYNIVAPSNRVLNLVSDIKNISKVPYDHDKLINYAINWYRSPVRTGGGNARVGYDIGQNDSIKYYKIVATDSTNFYFGTKNIKSSFMQIGLINEGRGLKSFFKNVILRDETDTDGDGIIDFEDICPSVVNPKKPSITLGIDKKLSSSNPIGNVWYKDGILTNDTAQTIIPKGSGNYTVRTIISGCVSSISDELNYIATPYEELQSANSLIIYPNPFTSAITVSDPVKKFQSFDLSVIEVGSGKVIRKYNMVRPNTPLDLMGFNSGVYIIKIINVENKLVAFKKIIKI